MKIICVYKNNLVIAPCDGDCGADYYPIYEKAEVICPNCNIHSEYGLLCSEDFTYQLVENSWDGFQPVDGISDVYGFIIVRDILNELI